MPGEWKKNNFLKEFTGNLPSHAARRSRHFKFPQVKYLPLREPDMSLLSALELQHIDFEIRRLGSMNASQLSEFSHGDTPWLSAGSSKEINYEMVFYRTPKYSVREYAN